MSGGEKQRITIARAILKAAPVVILDEATAYADPENEALVERAISKLVAGKTLVTIAHRLSTIKGADQILVVDSGRIVGRGTHDELLKGCALYARMWEEHSRTLAPEDGGVPETEKPAVCVQPDAFDADEAVEVAESAAVSSRTTVSQEEM